MSKTIEARIECPFYVKMQGSKLVCEGLLDCLRTSHTFADGKALTKWVKENCCVDFGRGCKHHRALMIKCQEMNEARKCNETNF